MVSSQVLLRGVREPFAIRIGSLIRARKRVGGYGRNGDRGGCGTQSAVLGSAALGTSGLVARISEWPDSFSSLRDPPRGIHLVPVKYILWGRSAASLAFAAAARHGRAGADLRRAQPIRKEINNGNKFIIASGARSSEMVVPAPRHRLHPAHHRISYRHQRQPAGHSVNACRILCSGARNCLSLWKTGETKTRTAIVVLGTESIVRCVCSVHQSVCSRCFQ